MLVVCGFTLCACLLPACLWQSRVVSTLAIVCTLDCWRVSQDVTKAPAMAIYTLRACQAKATFHASPKLRTSCSTTKNVFACCDGVPSRA